MLDDLASRSTKVHLPVQVWLLQDRLCYAPVAGSGERIQYISLDRITVRPLPRYCFGSANESYLSLCIHLVHTATS